jgi:hypothetical protein
MKSLKTVFTAAILVLTYAAVISNAYAQIIDVKGVGDAKVVDAQDKSLPSGEAAEKAITNAAVYAIDTALQSQSDNIRQQFQERVVPDEARRKEVRKMISNIKVETNPNTTQKTVRATISGKLDLAEFKDYMNRQNKLESTVKRSALEMAVFFTVRRSTQVARGAAVVTEANKDASNSESAKEEAEESGLTVEEAVSLKEKNTASTDIVEKADKVSWEADAQLKEPFGSGLIGQFTDKGFENVVDGSFFEVSDEMDKDISSRGQASPKTLKQLVNEVRAEGSMELIVIGSLDFSIPTKDPVSGMDMVEATMSGKVMKASGGGIPRTVAALEPKSFKAVGDTQEVAKKRVLEAMAPLTADEIISKLKNNGTL